MTKIVLRKRGRMLAAEYDVAQEVIDAIADGAEVAVTVKVPRNPRALRLYWAVLGEVVKSGAWAWDKETLDEWLKRRAGLVDIIDVNGMRIIRSKSIALESMGDDKFKPYLDKAMFLISTELLGDPKWEKFRDDLIARLEARYRDPREASAA